MKIRKPSECHGSVVKWLVILLAVPVVCLSVAAYGIYRTFTISGEVRELRRGMAKSFPQGWSKEIEVKAPRPLLWAGRRVVSWVNVEPDVRDAIQVVRGGQVGVYRLHEEPSRRQLGELLGRTDQAMDRRGWDRVVGVLNRHELVAVYMPAGADEDIELRGCVLVVSSRDLVLASVEGNLEPLARLVNRHLSNRNDWDFTGIESESWIHPAESEKTFGH